MVPDPYRASAAVSEYLAVLLTSAPGASDAAADFVASRPGEMPHLLQAGGGYGAYVLGFDRVVAQVAQPFPGPVRQRRTFGGQ